MMNVVVDYLTVVKLACNIEVRVLNIYIYRTHYTYMTKINVLALGLTANVNILRTGVSGIDLS